HPSRLLPRVYTCGCLQAGGNTRSAAVHLHRTSDRHGPRLVLTGCGRDGRRSFGTWLPGQFRLHDCPVPNDCYRDVYSWIHWLALECRDSVGGGSVDALPRSRALLGVTMIHSEGEGVTMSTRVLAPAQAEHGMQPARGVGGGLSIRNVSKIY